MTMPLDYELPDGRRVTAVPLRMPQLREEQRGPLFELRLGDETIAGHPVNSALAELLGYDVAHAEWPPWIDELGVRIEAEAAD